MIRFRVEIAIHAVFWILILLSLNVDWTASWFDASIRPSSPAPFSVVVFGIFFYVHTFWLLPRYFSMGTWRKYTLFALILFILPEVIRVVGYRLAYPGLSIERILFGRDSFLFGAPSPFFIAVISSFIYRFTRDRFLKSNALEESVGAKNDQSSAPYEDTVVLSEKEVSELEHRLQVQLERGEIFLNPDLTLRDLATAIGSSEKKVSFLLNQHLKTSFYELVNHRRVEKFKIEIIKPENENLSIVGVAYNCGFPSKSSFYRAFKAQLSMSPSEYLKRIRQGPSS